MKRNYKFKSKVVVWQGDAAWRFLILPKEESQKIRQDFKKQERGWSSHQVKAKIGKTEWETSIFYDRRSEAYLLPLKAQIRKKEDIYDDDVVVYSIMIK